MVKNSRGIRILRLESLEEMVEVERLQGIIWGYGRKDFDFPYPARALFALSESGGLVNAAVNEGQVVGFSVSWIGRVKSIGGIYLHSQLLGVLKEFRGREIGFELKMHQREYALSNDINLIRWTFDPLLAPNARLNLHKLGAYSIRFQTEYYGKLRSQLVHGSSDRLWAEWDVSLKGARRNPEENSNKLYDHTIFQAVLCENRLVCGVNIRVPVDLLLDSEMPEVLIEIPSRISEVAEAGQGLIAGWRKTIREALTYYLNRDYVVDDFIVGPQEPEQQVFYHLSRRFHL
jgi:predicted GNAT superfamily acetyltransferase